MTLLTIGLSLLCSLADNNLYPEGCKVVAAVLGKTQITSLKFASPTLPAPEPCMDFVPICLHLRQ